MNLLIVIGAGASYDCWPIHKPNSLNIQRLPLANKLFSTDPSQDGFLRIHELMGLASSLRRRSDIEAKNFDIEKELAILKKNADKNMLLNLFKVRFYLHDIITKLTRDTLSYTNSHTVYVDLLNDLKNWIDKSPSSRFVDIVVFNYDNLIEDAMKQVYSYDWSNKNQVDPLRAYYRGNNLKIFKPHGSINWGREILKGVSTYQYYEVNQALNDFTDLTLTPAFQFIDPSSFSSSRINKNYIPAIAIPFKDKEQFEECPQDMQIEMIKAVNRADKLLTFGWKGGDTNFTSLLKSNSKVNEIYIVSPDGTTNLHKTYSDMIIFKEYKSTFQHFVSKSLEFERVLSTFDTR